MFAVHSTDGYVPALDGIQRKTPVHGSKMLLSEFVMKKGSTIPPHAHPQDQTGYLVKGSIRLSTATGSLTATPGDSWYIPGNIEHWAEILEDTVAVEVFSPPREDYLPSQSV